MKVIAKLPDDKCLVEVTNDELANICGHYSRYAKEFNINIGIDINISDIYKKHDLIITLQKLRSYDTARKKLNDMLNALTPIEDKINQLIVTNEEPINP